MSTPAPSSQQNSVSAELLNELESIGSRVNFAAGEPVLREGEAGTGVYFLVSGSLSLSVSPQPSLAIPLRSLGPGSFVGLSSTLSCDHCCYTVTALEHSELIFVPGELVHDLLRQRPNVCLQVIQLLGQEMNSVCAERAFVNVRMQPVHVNSEGLKV